MYDEYDGERERELYYISCIVYIYFYLVWDIFNKK